MPKRHTPQQQSYLHFLIDASTVLGLFAITLEVAGMAWAGPAFQATVEYSTSQQNQITNNHFSEQHDTTGIKAPTFSDCERRVMRVRNVARRAQLLTLCHARSR